MKTLKLVAFFVAFLSFSNVSFAQSGLEERPPAEIPNVAFVLSKSASCGVCKANEKRVMDEVLSKLEGEHTKLVINDLSNKDTKEASANLLTKLEISDLVGKKNTGVIYFINLDTKKLISTISLAKPSKEIYELGLMALKG